jgi:hypothetical protein
MCKFGQKKTAGQYFVRFFRNIIRSPWRERRGLAFPGLEIVVTKLNVYFSFASTQSSPRKKEAAGANVIILKDYRHKIWLKLFMQNTSSFEIIF